jgi:hypothetical protein
MPHPGRPNRRVQRVRHEVFARLWLDRNELAPVVRLKRRPQALGIETFGSVDHGPCVGRYHAHPLAKTQFPIGDRLSIVDSSPADM